MFGSLRVFFIILACIQATLITLSSSFAAARLFVVTVVGLSEQRGEVHIALFHSSSDDGFPYVESALYTAHATPSGGSAAFVIPFRVLKDGGRYAVSAYEDVNGNGAFDVNFFGAPKEPFGFSGKVNEFPPEFESASFFVSTIRATNVSVRLHHA